MNKNNKNELNKQKFKNLTKLELPVFTNFYKFHLIDELVTVESPLSLPHGYCSCIGFLTSFDRLGSLKIPNLPR